MKYKSLLCMSALIAVLGCEEEKDAIVSSDGISTEQMYASIELVSAGNNQVIGNTQLTVLSPPRDNKSGDEYIELSASDRLWLSDSGSLDDADIGEDVFSALADIAQDFRLFDGRVSDRTEHIFFLFSHSVPNQIQYHSKTLEVEENAQLTVSLFRSSYTDAAESTVILPEDFTLDPLGDEPRFSRSRDIINLSWDTQEADLKVEAESLVSCIGGEQRRERHEFGMDLGHIQFDVGQLEHRSLDGECETTIKVYRIRTGTLDDAFLDGVITASQVRAVNLVTIN